MTFNYVLIIMVAVIAFVSVGNLILEILSYKLKKKKEREKIESVFQQRSE